MRASRTRFSTRGPAAGRGTTIRFRLGRPATVELVIRASDDCRLVGRKRIRGREGLNRVPFLGRVHGRPLSAGRYTITVVVIRDGTRRSIGGIAVEVVPPGRRLTDAQQSAPVDGACGPVGSAPSLRAALPAAVVPLTLRIDAGTTGPRQHVKRVRTGAAGVSFKPPKLGGIGGGAGGAMWLALAVYVGLGLVGATFVVFIARFVRGSWNP